MEAGRVKGKRQTVKGKCPVSFASRPFFKDRNREKPEFTTMKLAEFALN